MWIGLALFLSLAMGVKNFRRRHDPEPRNSRFKLPVTLLLLGGCIALAASGTEPVVFSILAAVMVVQIGFVLAGRNPWWMQGAMDRREIARYQSAPLPDLDPSA